MIHCILKIMIRFSEHITNLTTEWSSKTINFENIWYSNCNKLVVNIVTVANSLIIIIIKLQNSFYNRF